MISPCHTSVDQMNRELVRHGTSAFPVACYHDDLALEDVPWHWHDEMEVAIVTEGAIVLNLGGERSRIARGEGFFVNAGVLHSCVRDGAAGCRMHSAVFHPRLVGGSPESVFNQKYVLPVAGNGGFPGAALRRAIDWQAAALDAAEAAWQACAAEGASFELRMRDRLSELLALMAAHLSAAATPAGVKALRDAERIKRMLSFIMERFAEPLTTADIARSAALSESECLRCFRATVGVPPIRFLREYRIEQAARMLAASREPVADVAARCGFLDVSYFTKTFRELKGVTPGAYRALQGEANGKR